MDEEYTAGYKALFAARGYVGTCSKAKALALADYNEDQRIAAKRQALQQAGIYVGPLTDRYILPFFDLSNEFLRPSWLHEYKTRAADMDFARFRIAADGDKVIGACVFSDPWSDAMRFGPFGVDSAYQGQGIGAVLLADILAEMKSRGLESAWMQWCSDDPAANVLYDRAGFIDVHSYIEYEKHLQG